MIKPTKHHKETQEQRTVEFVCEHEKHPTIIYIYIYYLHRLNRVWLKKEKTDFFFWGNVKEKVYSMKITDATLD